MKKFCTNCGTLLEEGSNFCGSCGKPTKSAPAENVSPTQTPVQHIPPPPVSNQPVSQPTPQVSPPLQQTVYNSQPLPQPAPPVAPPQQSQEQLIGATIGLGIKKFMSGENVALVVTSRRLIFASQTMKLIGQYKGVHNIERYTKMPLDEIQRESPQNISIEYTQIRSISVKHGSAQKMVRSGFGGIGGGTIYGDGKFKIDSAAGTYEYTIVASYYKAVKELLAKVGINAD